MPVFRIDIVFADRRRFKEHHLIDGVELDAYYRRLLWLTQKANSRVISFDVVQVSEFSWVARFMRENNCTRWSRVQVVQKRREPIIYRKRW